MGRRAVTTALAAWYLRHLSDLKVNSFRNKFLSDLKVFEALGQEGVDIRNRSAKFRNRSAESLSETQRKMSSRFLLIPLKGLIGSLLSQGLRRFEEKKLKISY